MVGRRSKRAEILDMAARLFTSRGASRVTMDELASSVPVSKMTIYSHFGTKGQLLDEVIRVVFDRATKSFFEMVEDTRSFEDVITAISLYDYETAAGVTKEFLLDLVNNYPEKAQSLMNLYRSQIEPRLEQLILDAQQKGEVRRDLSAHVIVRFIQSMKESFSRPDMFDDLRDMELVFRQVPEILYRGILARTTALDTKAATSAFTRSGIAKGKKPSCSARPKDVD